MLRIRILYIDSDVEELSETGLIRDKLRVPWRVVDGPGRVYEDLARNPDPVGAAKKILYLTRNKGAFIRDCPGTSHYTCCGYRILHIGTYCTMDCAYCILQSYFHPPVLQYFVNHEDLFSSLDRLFSEKRLIRIGTGEFTDSLIWDDLLPFSHRLIGRFAQQDRAVLELKTKTVNIDHLLSVRHQRKTILAWSLNTETVIRQEERRTTLLNARLDAAARAQAHGYPLAFHFDPIIIYPDCEAHYAEVIDRLFQSVDPGNIVWISLGSLRFMPALKPVMEKRFPQTAIACGEFVKGLDGKMRYFKPLRIALYRRIIERIRLHAPDVAIYFCMEDDEVWRKSMGFVPSEKGGLSRMLDQSAAKCCGLSVDAI
jgi:spore photoproduct lyase